MWAPVTVAVAPNNALEIVPAMLQPPELSVAESLLAAPSLSARLCCRSALKCPPDETDGVVSASVIALVMRG